MPTCLSVERENGWPGAGFWFGGPSWFNGFISTNLPENWEPKFNPDWCSGWPFMGHSEES